MTRRVAPPRSSTSRASRRRRKRRRERDPPPQAAPRSYSPSSAVVALVVAGHRSASAAGAALRLGCSLDSLRPVEIGQNSFIYAADSSLLGAIPAERNRQPVPLSQISPWMPKATVAIEDRRFYQHGGIDFEGIARAALAGPDAPARSSRAARRSRSSSSRNLYIGHDERTIQRKLKEACLAMKLAQSLVEGVDPRRTT